MSDKEIKISSDVAVDICEVTRLFTHLTNHVEEIRINTSRMIKQYEVQLIAAQAQITEKDEEIARLKNLLDQNGIAPSEPVRKDRSRMHGMRRKHLKVCIVAHSMDDQNQLAEIIRGITNIEFCRTCDLADINPKALAENTLFIFVVQQIHDLDALFNQSMSFGAPFIVIYRKQGDFIPKDENFIYNPHAINGSPSSRRALIIRIQQYLLSDCFVGTSRK